MVKERQLTKLTWLHSTPLFQLADFDWCWWEEIQEVGSLCVGVEGARGDVVDPWHHIHDLQHHKSWSEMQVGNKGSYEGCISVDNDLNENVWLNKLDV